MTAETCVLPDCNDLVPEEHELPLCEECAWHAREMMNRILRERTVARDRRGWLYFIQVGERIKVGFTFSPKRRLKQYPPGSTLLAVNYSARPADEVAMHARLTQYRVAGREWYRDSEEIRAIMADVVAEHGKPRPIKWGSGQRRPTIAHQSGTRRGRVVVGPYLT